MNKLRAGALSLLTVLGLVFAAGEARAQSADGFLDTLKGVISDPAVGSFLMSRIAGPLFQASPPSSGQGAYGLAGSKSFGQHPGSYFYSLEEGAPFGGIGYDPALTAAGAALPQIPARPGFSQGYAPAQAPSQMTVTKRLAPSELRQLSRFDISVLIDRSGSMSTRDCPDESGAERRISRWQWCREESGMLSAQTNGALPSGITIVPFADGWQRFAGVTPAAISSIFNTGSAGGSTNLAGALQSELDRYFQERDAGIRQRPLMIAVITDGVPDSKSAVRRVIQQSGQRMIRPGEIKIVFFMIGRDRDGENFVNELADGLTDEGVPAGNFVFEHSFAEVNQVGLARSLARSAIQ